MLTRELFEQRSEKVPFAGCWIWLGTLHNGYGHVWDGSRMVRAHRAAFQTFHRPLADGECVCHRCDVPACVNPAHLFAASQLENIRDMDAKDRRSRKANGAPAWGVANGSAKVTPEIVRAIRCASGTFAEMSKRFGISAQQVSNIRARRYWAHVE